MSTSMKSRNVGNNRLPVSMGEFVSGLVAGLLATLLIAGGVVAGAYRFVKSTNENSVLRSEIVKVEKENTELEKSLQYRHAELERQKNSRNIIATARKLGMRPAYSNNVCYLQVIKSEQDSMEQTLVLANYKHP